MAQEVGFEHLPARRPYVALDFEDVRIIGRELEPDGKLGPALTEVGECQALVQAPASEDPPALYMNDALRYAPLAEGRQGEVCQVCDEGGVVLRYGSSEQGAGAVGDGELESRQDARVIREEAVLAVMYVTERIRLEKRVSILECETGEQSATRIVLRGAHETTLTSALCIDVDRLFNCS